MFSCICFYPIYWCGYLLFSLSPDEPALLSIRGDEPVSYTHLDVYKRQALLFGSQARGDARIDSDWDILIILDKEKLEPED